MFRLHNSNCNNCTIAGIFSELTVSLDHKFTIRWVNLNDIIPTFCSSFHGIKCV